MKIHPDSGPIFEYYSPTTKLVGVLSIPHSGLEIPQEFIPHLTDVELDLLSDVDFGVHELVDIDALTNAGVAVIKANISRVAVDLNRDPENTILYWKQNTKGNQVVTQEMTEEQIEHVTGKYYFPYFEMLKNIIRRLEDTKEGLVPVIDLHSMPSAPTEYHLKKNPNQNTYRPDFCLSDLHETSCTRDFIDTCQKNLEKYGYDVAINKPYFGGYITQYNDRFRTNTIQIEINRRLYMDEVNKKLNPDHVLLKERLTEVLVSQFELF